jgi:hypothetical protein
MLFQILAFLVALSLPALLVIEEINSWRKSHPGRQPQTGLQTVTGATVPEPPAPVQRPHGVLRAPQHKTA